MVYSLFIHSNVLNDSVVSGSASDILYRFSVDGYPLSYPFHVELKRSLLNKINATSVEEIMLNINLIMKEM